MANIVPVPITPPPGVVKTETGRVIQGRWIDSNMVRFVRGMPQKRGGWIKAVATPTSGVPRALHAWRDNQTNNYLAAGTFRKLYVYDASFLQNDVTPFRLSGTLNGPFSTLTTGVTGAANNGSGAIRLAVTSTVGFNGGQSYNVSGVTGTTEANGTWIITIIDTTHVDLNGSVFVHAYSSGGLLASTLVSVTHAGHGLSAGDQIYFGTLNPQGGSNFTTVGGITVNGVWTVNTVSGPNNYDFDSGTPATSTVNSVGGAGNFWYEIPIGTELGAYGLGWGVGTWGLGTWGTARSTSSIYIEPRVWALDHFGQILLANYNGGSIYTFDPTQQQPWPRAQIISAAPTDTRAIVVTPERFVFALRASMVVHWCDQGDFTFWTAGQTGHTALTRTLTEGTKLVAGRVLGPFVTLVWTDGAVYSFQYTGDAFVYNSLLLAKNCGLAAPGAAITAAGVAYWMGSDNFWMYDGVVRPMPNVEDIKRFVFPQLDPSTIYQAQAVYNPIFQEIEFFFTPSGQTSPQQSVLYSIPDQCWAPNVLGRTSGTNYTQGDTRPYMGSADGNIFQHENTNDAAGSPLTWSLTLAPYAITDGLYSMQVEGVNFDFFQQSGNITVAVNAFDYPDDTLPVDSETETIPINSGRTDFRLSGRFLSMNLSSSDLGNYMRYGRTTAFIRQTGRRP